MHRLPLTIAGTVSDELFDSSEEFMKIGDLDASEGHYNEALRAYMNARLFATEPMEVSAAKLIIAKIPERSMIAP